VFVLERSVGSFQDAVVHINSDIEFIYRRNCIVKRLIGLGGRTALPILSAITAACLLSVSSADAGLTATWSNWSANGQGATIAGTGPITGGTFNGNANNDNVTVTAPATGGNTAGSIASGGSYLLEAPNASNRRLDNTTFTIVLTLAPGGGGIASIQLAYIRGDATLSPTSITWAVSGTGSSGSIGTTTLSGTGWTSVNLTLNSLATTGTTLTLTGTFAAGGGNGTAGSIGFDDIQVTAVPEPINYALALFGLVFVGGSAGRFYLGRRRSAMVS
jgi:hypothetical protein